MRCSRSTLILLGFVALLLGGAIYLTSRPPTVFSQALEAIGVPTHNPPRAVSWSGNLPALIHPFSFAMLTIGILGLEGRRSMLLVCLMWFVIGATFEIGQHAALAPQLEQLILQVESNAYWAQVLAHYFREGTFDLLDLLHVALGSAGAYGVAVKVC